VNLREGLEVKKLIAASAVFVLAGVAGPAAAHSATPSHSSKVHTKLSPSKNVKPGTKLKLTGSKTIKNSNFSCLLVILHHNTAGAGTAYLASAVSTKSNKKGTFKCAVTFKPFTGLDNNNKTVACPPTKAEKKQGYSCAVAYYDTSTTNMKPDGYVKFTAKK
jgi:hypothetical protein